MNRSPSPPCSLLLLGQHTISIHLHYVSFLRWACHLRNPLLSLLRPRLQARCSVPECNGASLSRQGEDALWQQLFTAQPARRRVFEPSSKRRKKVPAPWPPATA